MTTDTVFLTFRVLIGLAIVGISVAICISDNRERRIPNNLVLAGLLLALLFNSVAPTGAGLFDRVTPGGIGLLEAITGTLAAFGLFFFLYLLRIMGAGDVKLMAFYGALFGGVVVVDFTITVFLCGGVLAVSRLFNAPRRAQVLLNLKLITLDRAIAPAGNGVPSFDPDRDTAERLPYALAICGAAVIVAFCQMSGYALPWSLVA